MEGDAEKYIKAGLDDYLPKPITKKTIYETLEKWFSGKKSTPQEVSLKRESKTIEELPILKTEILDSLKSMGSEEVLQNLFTSFLNDAETLVSEINKYLLEKNLAELRKSNHTINGLSGTIGASQVNKICIELSKSAREEDFKSVEKHVKLLNKSYEILKTHIQKNVLKQANFTS